MKLITLLDIKTAMRDHRFRDSLPPDLHNDVEKYMKNPGCSCNHPIYVRIAKECKAQLSAYFPGAEVESAVDKEIERLSKNNFSVINCHVNDLDKELKSLPNGKKQIAIARYDDQVTVIINELDF